MYDFTSLYPSEMVNLLPYGKERFRTKDRIGIIDNDNILQSLGKFYGFIRCRVRQIQPALNIPNLHCVRGKNGLSAPTINNWTEQTIFSEEIREGLQNGLYHYEVLDGVELSLNSG